jgi:OmpA-OmpF porin, OOP family
MNTTQSSNSWRWLGLFILLAILLILWLMGLGPSFSGDQAGCCDVPTATAPVPAPIAQLVPPPLAVTAPEPAKPEAVKLGWQLEDGKVTLTGTVPTEADRQKLVAAATETYGSGNVIDMLTIAANASLPSWWPNIYSIINGLKGINHYGLSQNGDNVNLSGEVANESEKDAKTAALQALLGDKLSINNLLTLAKPETVAAPNESKAPVIVCSADMNVAIKFANNSSHLSEAGKKQLDEIAKCLTKPTEVAGHTDNYGEDSYNLSLSKRRANAVIDYIKTVDPAIAAMLTATGYGETKPIASNATRASRAQNRRIEFVAK